MKLLLDTQVLVWLIDQDERLGEKTVKAIHNHQNSIFLSFMSLFELSIKASIGKLQFDPSLMHDLEKMGVELLSGDFESLQQYHVHSPENNDPFDNFLLSVAKAHSLTFVTSDQRILATNVAGIRVWDATI